MRPWAEEAGRQLKEEQDSHHPKAEVVVVDRRKKAAAAVGKGCSLAVVGRSDLR